MFFLLTKSLGMKLPPNVVDVFGMSKDGAFNAFSICLASEGGLFTIGGYNKSHHDKSDTIKYVPFYAESGQYRVHMNRIEVYTTHFSSYLSNEIVRRTRS